jgi:hypothetical protein
MKSFARVGTPILANKGGLLGRDADAVPSTVGPTSQREEHSFGERKLFADCEVI